MKIIKGKIPSAKKVVVYGPEGIGKSTFASQFPDPIFIDTEGSTKDLDVARFEKASSWTMLMEQIRYIKMNPNTCKTLVVDTADWAEQMCVSDLCARNGKKGIEDFGYGNGYVYAKEEFGRFLNTLEEIVEIGIHVVVTAHAHIRKFDQPDEMGSYDRWELKLGKKTGSQTAPLLKEWADMVLFANYKTYSIAVDDKGKKCKAQGGSRVMYTTHHACWDAKNRYGLPEELSFDYANIAHIIAANVLPEMKTQEMVSPPSLKKEKPEESIEKLKEEVKTIPTEENATLVNQIDDRIPKALRDLMIANHVDEWDIQNVVASRGYFPADMPIAEYPTDFITGVLVGAWEQVYGMIKTMKETDSLIFN